MVSPPALAERLPAPVLAEVEREVGVAAEDNGRFFNYDGEALPW